MKSRKFCALILVFLSVLMFSCKKQSQVIEIVEDIKEPVKTHKWYYFSSLGFSNTENLDSIPRTLEKPWTESVRISKAITYKDTAYLAVNRKGLIVCSGEEKDFKIDEKLFADNTIGTFLIFDESPIFHVYKNSLFNTTKTENNSVLIQYSPSSKLFYPLLQKNDLSLDKTEEVVSASFIDDSFVFSTKKSDDNSTEFRYYSLPLAEEGYLNFSGTDFFAQEFSVTDFRTFIEPKNYSLAPERLKSLLKVIPKDFAFLLHVQNEEGAVVEYVQQNSTEEDPQEAYAYIGDTYTSALFPDGTFYFVGGIEGKHILNSGKPVSMRLPKLPKGYKYTSYAITKTKLYCGFEEYNFYKTGITGFIEVDLENTLYKY